MPPSNQLPKPIRDELRMTVALRCYSILHQGKGMKQRELYASIFDLYHGKPPSKPSNLKLLCNASYSFKDLFDESSDLTTSKESSTSKQSLKTFCLKTKLHRDKSRKYFAGVDIVYNDLEKKNRTGTPLMSGRQIFDLAKKGTGYYRKALAFASRKYDIESMTCKESGSNEDDVIQYVRLMMYKDELKNKKQGDKDPTCEDSPDEKDCEKEEEYVDNNNSSDDNSSSNEDDDSNQDDDSDEANKTIEKTDTEIKVPEDYFFPSWFSFLTYGPFVSKEKRLSLLEINDPHKSIIQSRAEKRKAEKLEKQNEREADVDHKRGYSTDQQIQIELLELQKIRDTSRIRESLIIGLSIQENAISRQLESVERRALRYDEIGKEHKLWDTYDSLIQDQQKVIKEISDLNSKGLSKNDSDQIENNGKATNVEDTVQRGVVSNLDENQATTLTS